jgi:hypothetical protein
MSFRGVVFVVLMLLWLVPGCYTGYIGRAGEGGPDFRLVVGSTLIPWACVAILGWIVLGGPAPPPR